MWKALCICLIATSLYAGDTIHLVVPNFPPYTYQENENVQGIGVEHIKDIFHSISTPFTIRLVPNYGRAVSEVREGKADGFFLASQNSERDSIAQFSEPVVVNNWCWFTPKGSSIDVYSTQFKKEAKIATPLNSNTHQWLKENGYRIPFPVNNTDLYIKLIKRKKVDAIFIAEKVFLLQLAKEKTPVTTYSKKIEVSRDFGIYISHKTLEKNPQLMNKINSAIRQRNKAGAVE